MPHLPTKIVPLLALFAMTAGPIVAYAEPTEAARAEAKKHFDRAMELNEDGQVAQAIVELKRAYEIAPHHAVLYNLGQAYITLARPVEAAAALQRYLDEGGKAIKPDRRAKVEKEIARQNTRIATLEIRGLPDGALVTIDGDDVGKAPLSGPVRVGVGKHVVVATAPGYEPGEAKLEVAGEDSKVVELRLVTKAGQPLAVGLPAAPAPAVAAGPTTTLTAPTAASKPSVDTSTIPNAATQPNPVPGTNIVPAQPEDATGSYLRIGGWVMAGLGVAGLMTGGILVTTRSDAGGPSTAGTMCLISGLALSGVGILLAFPSPSTTKSVAFAPAAGPSFAGLSAKGTW